jgi:hypothetical protein
LNGKLNFAACPPILSGLRNMLSLLAKAARIRVQWHPDDCLSVWAFPLPPLSLQGVRAGSQKRHTKVMAMPRTARI